MTTRRNVLAGGLATFAVSGMPAIRVAKAAPSPARTVRAVMHAGLQVLDPIWTQAYISADHGALVYDTLFGLDAEFNPQPQMVSRWNVSDDKLTYTFELRDGLKFHDSSPVTPADCIASLRRWGARDGAGQHMFRRVKDTPAVDDRTFRIVLSEPYNILIESLAKLETSVCFMMRRQEAETDPAQQIREVVGSGPFMFNRDETRVGNRYIYDRNPDYVPRPEPASGMAGGKVVKIDRVVLEQIGDDQTALSALQNGEIDFYEVPPQDLIEQLKQDPKLEVRVLNKTGFVAYARLNHLHPPFDNVYARRAMLHLIKQEDLMRAIFGESDYWRPCGAYFGCDLPMDNDANTEWFKRGQDIPKARELFKQAGYDGRPVVILQAVEHYLVNPAALFMGQWLRQAGINADVAAMDWGMLVNRRAVKKPPAEGGWNIFATASTGLGFSNPIYNPTHAANGDNAWFGWPKNDLQETLRDQWVAAPTLEERKRVGREMQRNAWDYVQHIPLGQFYRTAAWRRSLKGLIAIPLIVPFWNLEKVA